MARRVAGDVNRTSRTSCPRVARRVYVARIRGGDVTVVGSRSPGTSGAAVWNTYVWVADADETAAEVRAAGGSVVIEPTEVGDAGRMAAFTDPAGATFCVWQAKEHRGATVVDEHASLSFNDLHTRDLDGARSFYAGVFGWEILDVGGGYMWALPGYGDFLEQRNPGMRENMAQAGAPRSDSKTWSPA